MTWNAVSEKYKLLLLSNAIADEQALDNLKLSKIKERTDHLKAKKKELNSIMKETEKEENVLVKKSTEFEKLIEEHLIQAYKRIRGSVINGLAIVPVQRGAAGGSFFSIPPQVQLDIASRNKIIIDEHSGRILVDPELAAEEENKIKKLI